MCTLNQLCTSGHRRDEVCTLQQEDINTIPHVHHHGKMQMEVH